MERGFLALVLHAHLPYVRHPEYEDALEENWLFETITETYVPLLLMMEQLVADGVDFRLTFTITPTLSSMLLDPFLQARYVHRLDKLIELAEKEITRTKSQPAFQVLASMYQQKLTQVRKTYLDRYHCNLIEGFGHFLELGKVDILASAATHGYLPLLSANASAVQAQIRLGVEHYQQVFGRQPKGFWLPECGYYPGLEETLKEAGIRFAILETHGITRSVPRPKYGVHAPVYSPAGVAFFGRDPESSKQVWSSTQGYPGDFDYREFYRDISYDLDAEYIRPYIHRDNIRIDSGIKYYRITGEGKEKEVYNLQWAEKKAAAHADHFLASREQQVAHLAATMDRKPIVVAPYDAELFGHWWYEGPKWLDFVIRKMAVRQDDVRLVTLAEYLEELPVNQVAKPAASSWGNQGHNQVWLNQKNAWLYPRLHRACQVLEDLVTRADRTDSLISRTLNQACRELLLAQASDWAFMIDQGTTVQYATQRINGHLGRFDRLCNQLESGEIDVDGLSALEICDGIFPSLEPVKAFADSAVTRRAKTTFPSTTGKLSQNTNGASPAVDLHVAMVSSEILPFAKTGGLADAVHSLAIALEELGVDVTLVMPAYRAVHRQDAALELADITFSVPVADRQETADVLQAKIGRNISVYLIRADRYFDREGLYDNAQEQYPDNAERFIFFARAALEVLRSVGAPDVLHCHDWQSALAPVLLKTQPERYVELSSTKTVLTIHNLGYQGLFPSRCWYLTNLDPTLFAPPYLEFHHEINFLKGGMVFADVITTVSPTYAREIQTADHGFGLEGVLRQRAAHLTGILNGADYQIWNPASDPLIATPYAPGNLAGKQSCKDDLQRHMNLPNRSAIPLLGMVSRLADQKGFDILLAALDRLLARDLQLVLLGSGDRRYETLFRSLPSQYPGKIAVQIGFDEALAHKIEAGADLFLMPSHYEPCGLNQLYSLKYGTIPVVRKTGGLADSVQEFDTETGKGTGFVFGPYSSNAFLEAIDRALRLFGQKKIWAKLMHNAMAADFSWSGSARRYCTLYGQLKDDGPA